VLLTTILGSSLAFIDGTVVTVALPVIQTAFRSTLAQLQWIVESYSLLLAALLLLGGSLGDRFGRRRVFVAGIIVFALASLWCGLAANVHHLIMARAVQGIGAALLVPGSLAIISASFSEKDRGRAIGTWSGFTSITAAIGPVLGGWLVEHASWRWVFFVNLPLAAATVALALAKVPESRSRSASSLDWPGASLATGGLGALVFGLIEVPGRGWGNPAVSGPCLGGLLLLLLFVFWESRSPSPMVPLSLFHSGDFGGANALTLFLYTALAGALFFIPFNLIQVQGYSPTGAGASLVPFILIMFLLSRWAGGLVARYGPRPPLIAGPLISTAGFALFAVPGIGGSYWTTFFPASCVLGFGMAVTVAPLTTTVMASAGSDMAGVASGINNGVSRVGGVLAIAVFGVVLAQGFGAHLDRALKQAAVSEGVREAVEEQKSKLADIAVPKGTERSEAARVRQAVERSYVAGFRRVMGVCAVLAAASAVCSWWMIGRTRGGRKRE
jgi:EmrB/QacA subfamily drug resistance transporter